VTHLDDLLALPKARGSATFSKMRLTEGLPRRPGVYLFKDRRDEIIYVGKAKNLRTRVRSYFYGDTRRSIAQMLTELVEIDHRVCETELEAEITEVRLIRAHSPRHNRRSKPSRSSHWVRVTDEAFPRLSLARTVKEDALAHIGPFRGRKAAQRVVEALWDATPIRRCTHRPGTRQAPCSFAQLGMAMCPCDGTLDAATYAPVVERLIRGLEDDPGLLLDPLADRIAVLAADARFEEAGWVRDRRRALERALERRHAWRMMQEAGTIVASSEDGSALIERGRLAVAWADAASPPLLPHAVGSGSEETPATVGDDEEAWLVWKWLRDPGTRIERAEGPIDPALVMVPKLERIAV
jgi:DNA polymerase-3 subunit epsilon